MGTCKDFNLECFFTDRDGDNACTLDECKYVIKIKRNGDASFTTVPIKPKHKSKMVQKKRVKKKEN